MSEPLVSIVIPVYNRAATINTALDSCLQQTYPAVEIIVVDDGSTDDTVAAIRAYEDRVRLIQQANQGPAIARNRGIEAARGAYVQFCDSDDWLHPEKITRCMALMQDNPELAVVFGMVQIVGADGQPLADQPLHPSEAYFQTADLFCPILKHMGSPLQTSSLLVRKDALVAVGAYRADPDQRCAEDWDLLLRLAGHYRFAGVPEILTYYRYHEDALTQNALAMAEGRLQTALYARDYRKRRDCIPDTEYDVFLAGRYHNLAMVLWRMGQPSLAREQFRQAIALTGQGRLLRRISLAATYLMSATIYERIRYALSVR